MYVIKFLESTFQTKERKNIFHVNLIGYGASSYLGDFIRGDVQIQANR